MFQASRLRQMVSFLYEKRFFTRLIITTALIAIIPSLLSNIVSYYKVSRTFEEESGRIKLQYINQTKNAMEMILKRIQENSNLLVLNEAILGFERFPNGRYYESLQGELQRSDLLGLYEYLEAKKKAMMTIHLFRVSNEYVHSVYFYDRKKELVLTSEHDGSMRQFHAEEFYDRTWQSMYENLGRNASVISYRKAEQDRGPDEHVLTYFYKTKDHNAVIVNLSGSKIYGEMIQKMNDRDDIYLAAADGTILLHGDQENLNRPIQTLLSGAQEAIGKEGSFAVSDGRRKWLVSHTFSPYLGWTFINVSDFQALSEGTASIKQTIVLSAGLLLFLSFALAYVSSKSLYQPIIRLKDSIGGDFHQRNGIDELGAIGNYMKLTVKERDYYKEKLEESLPIQREQFKWSLLHRHTIALDEIERRKAYLNIDIPSKHLAVFALAVHEDYQPAYDFVKLHLMEKLKQSAILNMKHFIAACENGLIAIVVNCAGMNDQQLYSLGERLLEQVNAAVNHPCTLGISRMCHSILELPQAFEEAQTALRYRILYGSGQVIAVDEIRIHSEHVFHYPAHIQKELLAHMKTMRKAEALQAFQEWMSDLHDHKSKLHYNQIQPIFMQLLAGILHELNQMGVNPNHVMGETDLYRELLELKSIEQIEAWFQHLIQQAVDLIQKEQSAKGNQHIAKVIQIMERDYDRDLSLHSVAEELSMNPAYISRLFKQMTGQTFVEYLKRIRIEKSKELLLNSSLKINEVGRRVGYEHSYYFIKVFKELMGLTPGEFKKLYGSTWSKNA